MRKKNKGSKIWKEMKPQVRRRLGFAVFLMFSMLGPLMVLMESKIRVVPWEFIIIQTIACGGFAACFILFFNRRWLIFLSCIFWLLVIVKNSGGFSIAIQGSKLRTVLGKSTGVVDSTQQQLPTFTMQELDAIYTQRTIIGLFAITFLAVGYSRFIFVIRTEIKERARLQTEMSIAQNIQASLLPANQFKNDWCTVDGITLPATEVGGDFFDVVSLSNDKVAIAVADVAGHGVGSGILSAMTKSAFRLQLEHNPEPQMLLSNLNNTLFELSDRNMFITFGYILLDYSTKRIKLATAGHPPILHLHQGITTQHRNANVALAMKKEISFTSFELTFERGDSLLLYTDGALEAFNNKGEQFGIERLSDVFARSANLSTSTCDAIMKELKSFSRDDNFKDDVSLVCIKLS